MRLSNIFRRKETELDIVVKALHEQLSRERYAEIAGIPVHLTLHHGLSLKPWYQSGIKNAALFHIDGHSDMGEYTIFVDQPDDSYFYRIQEHSFICAAAHYGILSQVYWLNPHSTKRRLQFLGYVNTEKARLRTKKSEHGAYVTWIKDEENHLNALIGGYGEVIPPGDISLIPIGGSPLILDIDLDAFCCHREVDFSDKGHNGVSHYKQRISNTIRLLSQIKKPDLVTITQSQEFGREWVPGRLAKKVQYQLIEGLVRIYSD